MTRPSTQALGLLRALALVSVVWAAWSCPASADPDDFVVQQVCVDAADRPVQDDPAHCPHARKLRLGEPIPFRRVDGGNWQALYSYPVRGPAGERRAMAEKVFGGSDATGSFGDLGVRSGYDLLEIGPRYVSGIRTSDQGGGDQIFWRTRDCVRTDGWIFFPPGLQPGQYAETVSTLKITHGPSTACPDLGTIAPDLTTWGRPVEPFRYTSGKVLDTIISQHFAYPDPASAAHDDDSMERFYFTKPYGFSRWEAWGTLAGCRKRALNAGKAPDEQCRASSRQACNGPNTGTFYGKAYLRLDCRDSTFTVADPVRPFNPLLNASAPGDVAGRNLLANGTFADGPLGWSGSDAAAPRLDARRQQPDHNAVLDVTTAQGGVALAQEFDVPPGTPDDATLVWGLSVWAGDTPVRGTLALTLRHRDGAAATVTRVVTIGPNRQDIAVTTPVGASVPVRGRLELRLDGAATVTVDDAFVTPVADPR